MKVDWWLKNLYTTQYDYMYIQYDTEGSVVRLKIYEEGLEQPFIDDTSTNTNRSGRDVIAVVSPLPHLPPTTGIVFYTVVVEVYDTNNVLRETHRLKYAMSAQNLVTLNFKDEKGNTMISYVAYVTTYNNEKYFRVSYYGTLTFPYPAFPSKSYVEFIRVDGDKKYYYLDRIDRICTGAGTYNITLKPKKEIVIYIDVELSNTIINQLMSIPGLNYLTNFLLSLGTNLFNFGLTIGNYVKRLLGLEDYYVIKAEKVSDSPPIIRLYFRTDIAPILVVLILGLAVAGTAITWIVMSAIRDMRVAELTYQTEQVITQRYTEYIAFTNKVWEWAQTQPDPPKAFNEIISNITPPPTGSDEAKNTIDPLASTIETLKSFLLIAVVVAVVIAVVSYLRK